MLACINYNNTRNADPHKQRAAVGDDVGLQRKSKTHNSYTIKDKSEL